MIKVGITGNIGSGKSYICNIFESKGIPVFYSDKETKRLYLEPKIKQLIISRFGEDVYLKDGNLNKTKLSQILFGSQENLKFIEDTLYPALFKRFSEWCGKQSAPFVLFESAILFEKQLTGRFDRIIFISAPEDIRIQRVIARDKCTVEAVRSRMKLQWSDETKVPKADHVIVHDGNDDIEKEVGNLIAVLSRTRQNPHEP
ncbi:MAG: dephospho-CoA kinase [Bacteroidales bacterium]|nr:dephospho-CoA kinase [Bacteroidales bacterium]